MFTELSFLGYLLTRSQIRYFIECLLPLLVPDKISVLLSTLASNATIPDLTIHSFKSA